ncbi:MAG: ABC transporter ATP-binding protein [Ignisphaera sp.]
MGSIILDIRNIHKRFGGVIALDDVSISVREKEFLGIIGPNGSGKTTLFNVITGFYKPERGRIFFRGIDITGWAPYKISRLGIARTFQIMKPLENLSTLDNVVSAALPRSRDLREAVEMAEKVLEIVKLSDKKDLPAGSLNAVEKRRLELARALAGRPQLLLLDEVLAGHTPVEIEELLKILKEIHMSGVTIIMVEHIMRAIMRIAERIIVLNFGRVIAEGSPEEVSKDPRVIEVYLGGFKPA